MRAPRLSGSDASALARSVAHEINNIAASMLGFVELAAERAPDDGSLVGSLAELRLGVERLIDLARALSSLAEAGAPPAAAPLAESLPRAQAKIASTSAKRCKNQGKPQAARRRTAD